MLQIFKAETYCARSKWAYGLANLHKTFLTRFRSRSSHFLFILLEQTPMPAKQPLFFFDWEILISGQVRVCSALMKSAATQRPEQLSSFDSGVSILSFLLTWSFLQVAPGKTLYTQSATVKLAAKCADFAWLATRRTDRNECAETPWNRNTITVKLSLRLDWSTKHLPGESLVIRPLKDALLAAICVLIYAHASNIYHAEAVCTGPRAHATCCTIELILICVALAPSMWNLWRTVQMYTEAKDL